MEQHDEQQKFYYPLYKQYSAWEESKADADLFKLREMKNNNATVFDAYIKDNGSSVIWREFEEEGYIAFPYPNNPEIQGENTLQVDSPVPRQVIEKLKDLAEQRLTDMKPTDLKSKYMLLNLDTKIEAIGRLKTSLADCTYVEQLITTAQTWSNDNAVMIDTPRQRISLPIWGNGVTTKTRDLANDLNSTLKMAPKSFL